MSRKTKRFFNRELSWIEFNARVLEQALDSSNPLLERVKFTGIVTSNFDEFFLVRVAGLKRLARNKKPSSCPTGMTPLQQLRTIRQRVNHLVESQQKLIGSELIPALTKAGIRLVQQDELVQDEQRLAADLFESDVFPLLTPLRIEQDFPFVENLTLHVVVSLSSDGEAGAPLVALVRIPQSIPRFLRLDETDDTTVFTPIETVVSAFVGRLFPGYRVHGTLLFRVTRDADLGVDEEREEDFLSAMEEVLASRQRSIPVRLEVATPVGTIERKLKALLVDRLGLDTADVYEYAHLLAPSALVGFAGGFDERALNEESWPAVSPAFFEPDMDVFASIRERDRILHLPYESFEPVLTLMHKAATDPDVLAIKITLYRTSGHSPIVSALKTAAERGVQVTAFVELKARFDEEQNINWAQELEQVGVIVVHGIANLKVHAKACMIIRRERGGIRRYVHLSTGNYNDKTARIYSDIGLFTANEEMAIDVASFFNSITGYSSIPMLTHLVMAPTALKARVIELIRREIGRKEETGTGRIVAKLNSLADPDVIDALYDASRAGVSIRLNVRGICMLVPGIEGMSDQIEVISIVDRYLEHSRVFLFENGGIPELYLSSADWMPRNLERRVELLFPILDEANRERIRSILENYFEDNTKSWRLLSDGSYRRTDPAKRGKQRRAQRMLYEEAVLRAENVSPEVKKEFTVRRSHTN